MSNDKENAEKLDEAVEKLTGAITMFTARVDHRLLIMALFKLFANEIIHIQDKKFLLALADDFANMSDDLVKRANTTPTSE